MIRKPLKPIVLLLIEGFGLSTQWSQNALRAGGTPNFDDLWQRYRHYILKSPINTENIINPLSALEIISFGQKQFLPLDLFLAAAENNHLKNNINLQNPLKQIASHHSACHIFAAIPSDPISFKILNGLLTLARENKIFRQHLHLFYNSKEDFHLSEKYLDKILADGTVSIGTVFSRELICSANEARKILSTIFNGLGRRAFSIKQALKHLSEERVVKNQFITIENPGIIDFDGVIFTDPSADCRFLLSQFQNKSNIISFEGRRYLSLLNLFATPYSISSGSESVFNFSSRKSISQFLANSGYNSKIIASKDREEYFKYFFGSEIFSNEKFVDGHDEDNKFGSIVRELLNSIKSDNTDFIITDLDYLTSPVTRGFEGVKSRVRQLDKIFPLLEKAILSAGGILFITSPFGYAEQAVSDTNGKFKPTLNPLPFIAVSGRTSIDPPSSKPLLSELLGAHKEFSFIYQTSRKALVTKI